LNNKGFGIIDARYNHEDHLISSLAWIRTCTLNDSVD